MKPIKKQICLNCKKTYKTSTNRVFCPQCRKRTAPGIGQMKML